MNIDYHLDEDWLHDPKRVAAAREKARKEAKVTKVRNFGKKKPKKGTMPHHPHKPSSA